jgi:hypothetical protein
MTRAEAEARREIARATRDREREARREIARATRDREREAQRETRRRAAEDEHGRETRRFAGSAMGREAWEKERAAVLKRRAEYDALHRTATNPAAYLPRLWVLPVAGGGGSSSHPFKVINASTATAAKVRVVPGSVNNVMPRVGTDENSPTGTPEGWPTLTVSASGYVYLRAVWEGAELRTLGAAALFFEPAIPADEDAASNQLIAQVFYTAPVAPATVGTLVILPGVTHSLFCERVKCGAVADYYWNAV